VCKPREAPWAILSSIAAKRYPDDLVAGGISQKRVASSMAAAFIFGNAK
jgi:hypothetical protein